jgi:hypothetical protein
LRRATLVRSFSQFLFLFLVQAWPDHVATACTADNLGDLINFSKRELVASAIRELQQYQQQAYNLLEVPRISALFVNLPTKSDDELYNLSLKREPRGADRSAIA